MEKFQPKVKLNKLSKRKSLKCSMADVIPVKLSKDDEIA
jgi:hypothetical protein